MELLFFLILIFDTSVAHEKVKVPKNSTDWIDSFGLYKEMRNLVINIADEQQRWLGEGSEMPTVAECRQLKTRLNRMIELVKSERFFDMKMIPEKIEYSGPKEWYFFNQTFETVQPGKIAGYVKTSTHYVLSFKVKLNKMPLSDHPRSIIHIGNDTLENQYPSISVRAGSRSGWVLSQSKDRSFFKHNHNLTYAWTSNFWTRMKKGQISTFKILKEDEFIKIFMDSIQIGELPCKGVYMANPDELQPIRIGADFGYYDWDTHVEIGDIWYKHLNDPNPKIEVPQHDNTLESWRMDWDIHRRNQIPPKAFLKSVG